MLFSSKPLTSALVAMVTLSIAASASLDPIEQHLATRDSTAFQPSKEAGKLAAPVNLGNTQVSPQAVLKLTGDDLHSNGTDTSSLKGASAIAVPAAQTPPRALVEDAAHCHLGHATASIKRVRYTMTVKVDRDESGDATIAKAQSVHGVVIKATSGLYSSSNPDKGSCAKTLARHGEVCANRPYIVPQSLLHAGGPAVPGAAPGAAPGAGTSGEKPKPDTKEPWYHAGPFVTKRSASSDVQASGDWDKADDAKHLVFKRDAPAPQPDTRTDISASGTHASTPGPAGTTVCIDTVKRDKKVTKVVPTKANNKNFKQTGAEPLHFEFVRSDDKENVWDQIIYNAKGEPIDVTHLSLTSNMSFWRAEYGCKECPKGHQNHTVLYEHVEIEVDSLHEEAHPAVVCEGNAKSTNVHKKDKSRYAKHNKSTVDYTGTIFAIDRVTLGKVDAKGKGGAVSVTEAKIKPVSGEIPAQQKPAVEDSKSQSNLKYRTGDGDAHTAAHLGADKREDANKPQPDVGAVAHEQPAAAKEVDPSLKDDRRPEPSEFNKNGGQPNGFTKRNVVVEDNGPVF